MAARRNKKATSRKRPPAGGRVKDLLLLQRVAQRINSVLDLDTLLEEIVDDVARTFGYSRSGILLIDEKSDELVIAAVRGWTVNYHVKGDRFKIGKEGMIGHVAATGKSLYAPDVTKNRYYLVSEVSTRSEFDVPLRAHGRLIGVFNAQTNRRNGFPANRRQLLEALAGHIGTAIENARLFGREREQKERMAKELDRARRIQESYFPSKGPLVRGFEIDGSCFPCTEVGGDWYDYITLPDGRVGVVLADVSGKGLAAALLMASARSIVRSFAEQGLPPAEVLSVVNRVLLRDFPKPNFVTMIYAVLDPASQTVEYANAGHHWPLLVEATARFLDRESGFPLGLFDTVYSEETIPLPAGSTLIFYSDGVFEAAVPSVGEYGAQRMLELAARRASTAGDILEDARQFARGFPAADDMTVLMIRGRETTPAREPMPGGETRVLS